MKVGLWVSRRIAEALIWLLKDYSNEIHLRASREKDPAEAKQLRATADDAHATSDRIAETLKREDHR